MIDADNPAWIYAGVTPLREEQERRALHKSTDSGETWARIKVTSLSHEYVICLAMSPAGAQPAMIYAGLRTSGTYKSDDRGETWTHTSNFLPWALLVDPQQAHRVYAGTGYGKIVAPQAEIYYRSELYKSTDRGETWVEKDSGLPEGTIAAMVIDPRNGHIFAGLAYGGVYRSVDGADTWHMAGRGLDTTYIKDLAVHPDAADTVLAAVWGQGHHLARTRNRGGAWQYLTGSQAPAHIGAVAVAAQDPDHLFAGDARQFNAALHVHRSLDGGQTWIPPGLLFESGDESRVYDIWVHPGNSQVVLAAAADWARVHGGVYKSTDGGTSFRRTLDHWRATTLAADPQHPEILYCGTYEDGHVFRSADTGETWTRTSPEGFWVSRVKDLAVAANSELYAATTGGLMKWDGVAWNRLAGLPSDDTTAVDLDRSTDPAVIYAGTGDQGMFFSSDQGLTWIPFTAGLANPSITRLAVSRSRPTVVYAGTNLGGVWQTMIIAPGDVNGDSAVDLADAVLALQIAAGTAPTAAVFPEADIDRDLHIGPAEAVYALQAASGERSFRLASSVFIDNNPIPSIYTCDAADVSPPLAWRQVPPGAQSLVLIMDDPDTPGGTWDHWIVYDIPAAVSALAVNAGAPGGEQLPAGARQGTNSWNNSHYQGPCPPGGTHRYFFKLYAVNVASLNLAGTSKGAVEVAMAGKIVGQVVLMGTYTRLP